MPKATKKTLRPAPPYEGPTEFHLGDYGTLTEFELHQLAEGVVPPRLQAIAQETIRMWKLTWLGDDPAAQNGSAGGAPGSGSEGAAAGSSATGPTASAASLSS